MLGRQRAGALPVGCAIAVEQHQRRHLGQLGTPLRWPDRALRPSALDQLLGQECVARRRGRQHHHIGCPQTLP